MSIDIATALREEAAKARQVAERVSNPDDKDVLAQLAARLVGSRRDRSATPETSWQRLRLPRIMLKISNRQCATSILVRARQPRTEPVDLVRSSPALPRLRGTARSVRASPRSERGSGMPIRPGSTHRFRHLAMIGRSS